MDALILLIVAAPGLVALWLLFLLHRAHDASARMTEQRLDHASEDLRGVGILTREAHAAIPSLGEVEKLRRELETARDAQLAAPSQEPHAHLWAGTPAFEDATSWTYRCQVPYCTRLHTIMR